MNKRLFLVLAVLTGMFLLSASIVWAQPAPVAKTGQTTSYRTGDDGDHEKGVSTSPRFTDNEDNTVTDNLTGLMWTKHASPFGKMTWEEAIDMANNLSGGNAGCGGSYTDWRLPNRFELESLLDLGNYNPALPTDHPFINVQSSYYWSSTTQAYNNFNAWYVGMSNGYVDYYYKTNDYYVWPVRGGN
jgi:hypothetical protein